MPREIEGWRQFQIWLDDNVDSVEDREKCSVLVYGILHQVRLKDNQDRVICQCNRGFYCNVECNL